ncbi:MAG: DinB family protein [Fimbriimonadaceae bacterium]|nr:DinB family protein [Fimbriimonadaceae bacterium]QOJ12487.1 MAG: DinB family protein [Chthonomonadaceae bacterium]
MSEAILAGPKEDIAARIQMGSGLLQKDLAAMSDQMLANCPGGEARCGFDLVYEMAMVNRLVAGALRGDAGDIPEPQGWVRSPQDYRNKAAAMRDLSDSVEELLSAFATVSEQDLAKEIPTPLGKMPIGQVMSIMGSHLMYHSGQLNYIQTLHGDVAFHWAEG